MNLRSPRRPPITWPDGARFAFTVFDDTDRMTIVNGPPVYDLLTDLGIRITKSVWPLAPAGPPRTGGTTCEDAEYAAWAQQLQERGHEIGFHNASDHPSTRDETIAGLDRFVDLFGADPRIGADHSGNTEAMYWGPARLTGSRAWAYRASNRLLHPDRSQAQGHVPDSAYFWGDVLAERIDYWRNFTFTDSNVLNACPKVPYHDPSRPYVNWWFASSHAPRRASFLELITPERLDRLEAEGGLCIVYTHFGVDFAPDGVLHPDFVAAMEHLASRRAWFAPASTVLDHVRAQHPDDHLLDAGDRRRMENRWIADQVRARGGAEARRALRRLRR